MEGLIDTQHGTSALLAGIVVVLCLHLLAKIGEFLFEMFKKKEETTEKNLERLTEALKANTELVQKLDSRITAIERDLNEVLKFRIDFRRLFSAVKFIAGDQWPEAKKAMKDYDLE